MSKTRSLARLSVLALGVVAIQALVAEEPANPVEPAKSVREWMATPPPAPAEGEPAAPAGPATSIREWRTAPGQAQAAPAAPAKSIKEWRTPAAPAAATAPCPMSAPIATAAAAPASSKPAAKAAAGPKSPIAISLKSSMREGNLVIVLDDVAVFSQKFEKPFWVISQTTEWKPLQIPSGNHRLTAKVIGAKKTYFSKTYDLYVSPTKGSSLKFVMQGDKLTVALAS
jgi:hypothetical protein